MSYTINGREAWNNRGLSCLMQVRPRKFMAWLRQKKIYTPANLPSFEVRTSGYATTRPGNKWAKVQVTWWYSEGLDWLRPKIEAAKAAGELEHVTYRTYPDDTDLSQLHDLL